MSITYPPVTFVPLPAVPAEFTMVRTLIAVVRNLAQRWWPRFQPGQLWLVIEEGLHRLLAAALAAAWALVDWEGERNLLNGFGLSKAREPNCTSADTAGGGRGSRRWSRIGVIFAIGLLFVFFAVPAQAVHKTGAFQLDG